MATNDFLPFATGGAANVLTQAQWAALSALLNGFQSGIADSKSINKAFRQSSIMSAVLAQFIVDETGANATDDGTTATLLANLKNATSGRLINVQVFDTVGANTYTKTSGATYAIADVQGGGGQGGGSPATGASTVGFGSGGHSGAGLVGKFSLSGVINLAVTVGAGGQGGAAGAAGGTGGTSSVGALITCPGGAGGGALGPTAGPAINGNTAALPIPTASGSVQIISQQGGNSGMSGVVINAGAGYSGAGGLSPRYGGGTSVTNGTGPGNPGQQVGQGGSGAFTAVSGAAQVGGAGTRGKVIIYEYA